MFDYIGFCISILTAATTRLCTVIRFVVIVVTMLLKIKRSYYC